MTSIGTPRVGIHVPNTRSASYEDTVRPIVEDLQENLHRGRLRRLPDVARRLGPVLDVLLADLLRTPPYVVHVSNSYGVRLMGDDIAARHEFGVRIGDAAERARAPWSMPRGGSVPPIPFHRLGEFWIAPEDDDRFTGAWHVYGALMSLDLALARFHLPRLAGVIPSDTPAVLPTEENYFAHGATLFNPARVTRVQVGEIAVAIRAGRARLEQLLDDPSLLPDVARDAELGVLRRNELAWTLRYRPDAVGRFLSRTELFWLGLSDGQNGADRPPYGWGAPAVWLDGCLCVRIPPPDALDLSVVSAERLASGFADLQLALVEAVDALRLPAPISGDLLPLAMRELLDGVSATRRGRLDALVGYVPGPRIVRVVARFGAGGRLVRSMRARGRPAALVSAGTDVVLVPVMVQDRRGRFVDDLALEDFELLEDGVRQDASFFEAANTPLDLVLAVDFQRQHDGGDWSAAVRRAPFHPRTAAERPVGSHRFQRSDLRPGPAGTEPRCALAGDRRPAGAVRRHRAARRHQLRARSARRRGGTQSGRAV